MASCHESSSELGLPAPLAVMGDARTLTEPPSSATLIRQPRSSDRPKGRRRCGKKAGRGRKASGKVSHKVSGKRARTQVAKVVGVSDRTLEQVSKALCRMAKKAIDRSYWRPDSVRGGF